MPARVRAPLYAYPCVYGSYPISSKPEELTPKKSGGSRSMTELERWVLSAKKPSPTESTSTTTDESQPEEPRNPVALRILTWNIWFENAFKQQRTSTLIATIKSLDPLPDVCCFQECTAGFEKQLHQDDWWRETWAMTKCADQFRVTGFTYGTMAFVKRELIGKMEFEAKAWFEPFEVGHNGRGLLVLELTPPRSKHPLLIATSHLEYTPGIRATQFASGISTLSATPTSVFCGDTNIDSYPELEPLLSAGYVDSWLETHPDVANSPDLRAVGATYGTVGLRLSGSLVGCDGLPRRLDYVMARGVKVVRCELVGDELIPKEKWAEATQGQELELEVHVSDHLGVLVDVELA